MDKKDEKPVTLEVFLEKTKLRAGDVEHLGGIPSTHSHTAEVKGPRPSDEARDLLKGMVDKLADLADAGDRGAQAFLMDFGRGGKYLIDTASDEPGKPCPGCGKIH